MNRYGFTVKSNIWLLVLALFTSGCFSSLRGAVYTIGPSDNVPAAIGALKPGDTLQFRAGTYTLSIDSNNFAIPSGTASAPITWKNYPGESPLFKSGGAACFNIASASIRYLILDGFRIDGGNLNNSSTALGDGVSIYGASYITVQNSEIFNAPGNGIITHNSTNNIFLRLRVHDNGYENPTRARSAHGFYITDDYSVIDSCEVYNNHGYGVHIYNYGGGPDYSELRNSRVYGNGRSVYSTASAGGVILASGRGNKAIGNEVSNNLRGSGVDVTYGAIDAVVDMNKISGNPGAQIAIGDSQNAKITNNCVDPIKIANQGSGTTLQNNLPAACSIRPTSIPGPTNLRVK